jgi:glycosyltransferase involved in cell wall biosynthesis
VAATNDAFTIFSCSSIIPLKRLDYIIRLISQLPFRVHWIHAGAGPLQEITEQKANAELTGPQHSYHFTGHLEQEELMSFYCTQPVDLFLNLSDSEGLPVSIMEAMSFGIPVMARNVGGVREAVNDGTNGFLLPEPFSVEQAAVLVTKYYQKRNGEKELYRKNSRQQWEEKFDAGKNYPVFIRQCLS